MEIKFRAWDKKNKEMHQLITWHDPRYLDSVEYSIGQSSKDIRSLRQDKNCIIMQYTGIKDKAGKEIYDRDLVLVNGQDVATVYTRGGCWFVEQQKEFGILSKLRVLVVGNIYEHAKIVSKMKGEN